MQFLVRHGIAQCFMNWCKPFCAESLKGDKDPRLLCNGQFRLPDDSLVLELTSGFTKST